MVRLFRVRQQHPSYGAESQCRLDLTIPTNTHASISTVNERQHQASGFNLHRKLGRGPSALITCGSQSTGDYERHCFSSSLVWAFKTLPLENLTQTLAPYRRGSHKTRLIALNGFSNFSIALIGSQYLGNTHPQQNSSSPCGDCASRLTRYPLWQTSKA